MIVAVLARADVDDAGLAVSSQEKETGSGEVINVSATLYGPFLFPIRHAGNSLSFRLDKRRTKAETT